MIARNAQHILQEMARQFPVVTVTGPRQSGKTTLTRMTFHQKDYVNLERPDTRSFAETDPVGFLAQFPQGAIIDEIQHVPELLSYVQSIVDEKKTTGLFILTGSNQFEYLNSINQSLAGRTAILKLLPFSYDEIYTKETPSVDTLMVKGFYPRFLTRILSQIFFIHRMFPRI